ncbi:hypothetical protein HYU94_01110 [Candidatus Daviesbacteria bacterium]|nr:hypothetical protein [Candidatus Daviesbacteria bacterium]
MSETILGFDPSKLNIITTTFYRRWVPAQFQWRSGAQVTPEVVDKVRGDLAIQMISKASEKGVRTIVVDGVNNRPFRQALERQNVFIFDETDKGMSASKQQGYRIAQVMPDMVANLWTEPEKVSIAEDCLDPLMTPIFTGEADIVIPLRGAESFSTYPDFQADIEQESNRLWNALLKAEGIIPYEHPGFDNWFGPRGWHKDITGLFIKKYKSTDPDVKLIKPEEYGNALHFPVITALIEGKRVISVQVPFRYPEIQKAIEEDSLEFRAKRKYQQESILETTKEFLALLRSEQSRLVAVS